MSDILMAREGADLVAWRQGMTDLYASAWRTIHLRSTARSSRAI